MSTSNDKAVLVQVAEAVTAAIKEHDFGIQFTLEMSYADFEMKLEQLDELRVDVVPVGYPQSGLAARGMLGYRCSVDIGLRKRFEGVETETASGRIKIAEINRLVKLTEDIHEHLCGWAKRRLADNITWSSTEIRAAYIPDHLKNMRQFTSLIGVVFDVKKPLPYLDA